MDFARFESEMVQRVKLVDGYIQSLFDGMDLPGGEVIARSRESMRYSAMNGGKRFRPVLSLLVGEIFRVPAQKILPFAAAVEFIHTYSLIHDDLPCMDNDDVRRGKPTNHKVYGEAGALLAGDALLTESFLLIAAHFHSDGTTGLKLIEMLSRAAGIRGMVGGQALDLGSEGQAWGLDELQLMHQLKTGCLIEVSVSGATRIAGLPESKIKAMSRFGQDLGLAFQIADDLLDADEKNQESRSFVPLLGVEGTKSHLRKISERALASLHEAAPSAPLIEALVEFNLLRKI